MKHRNIPQKGHILLHNYWSYVLNTLEYYFCYVANLKKAEVCLTGEGSPASLLTTFEELLCPLIKGTLWLNHWKKNTQSVTVVCDGLALYGLNFNCCYLKKYYLQNKTVLNY